MSTFAFSSDIKPSGYVWERFQVIARVNEGQTPEMMRSPSFWSDAARRLKPKDEIEVLADDGSWEMRLRVMAKTTNEVFMRELEFKTYDPVMTSRSTASYVVQWGGNTHKHRVIKIADPAKPDAYEVVEKGFDDRMSAETWAAANIPGFKAAA